MPADPRHLARTARILVGPAIDGLRHAARRVVLAWSHATSPVSSGRSGKQGGSPGRPSRFALGKGGIRDRPVPPGRKASSSRLRLDIAHRRGGTPQHVRGSRSARASISHPRPAAHRGSRSAVERLRHSRSSRARAATSRAVVDICASASTADPEATCRQNRLCRNPAVLHQTPNSPTPMIFQCKKNRQHYISRIYQMFTLIS